MADLTDAAIKAAIRRGQAVRRSEPRAIEATYDKTRRRLGLQLGNGCEVSIPADALQGFHNATDIQIAAVTITADGYGLHWAVLDIDLSVPGLLAGLFGTTSYMAQQAGKAKSDAKARASRANGTKGGRPRKTAAAS